VFEECAARCSRVSADRAIGYRRPVRRIETSWDDELLRSGVPHPLARHIWSTGCGAVALHEGARVPAAGIGTWWEWPTG